jgi:phosphate transport system ATP-binding protein
MTFAPEGRLESNIESPVLEALDLRVRYRDTVALDGLSLAIPRNRITAIIGPSGSGKSTLLRSFNRMVELWPGVTMEGDILYDGHSLFDRSVDPVEVRRQIGMVFQRPNPFPKSVYDNVAWGPSIHGLKDESRLDELVQTSLQRAGLWEEVRDRLQDRGTELSGGQQQRLCIARALAMDPRIVLMDEPCSSLDPVSTNRIEDLLFELRGRYTIVIVTHSMGQAARVSDYTAFLEAGRLIEFGETDQVFTNPVERRTEQYVTGRFR